MNHNYHSDIRLVSRNEGKIKSYESCCDLRAWSHDIGRRDHYLREWIKCDMPVCVIPTSTLICILKKMTYSSRGNAAPRCHPRCKSKVVLESICASCHAMKECFRNEEKFDRYFQDEEFETSDWPCEKCLDALKSIKMFWKIIIDKLFPGSMTKSEQLTEPKESRCIDNVLSVAKTWQNDMLHQASFVKNIMPLLKNSSSWRSARSVRKETHPCHVGPDGIYAEEELLKQNKSPITVTKCHMCKTTNTSDLSFTDISKLKTQNSKQILAKMQTAEIGCGCRSIAQLNAYKINLDSIQEKFQVQKDIIEKLKRENGTLKMELKNVYKNVGWKSWFSNRSTSNSKTNTTETLPMHFKCYSYENHVDTEALDPIDSEMIITMKNCKDESFKHISLLQVLHKTNTPVVTDVCCNHTGCKKQDPIALLTKVQDTFGAIVDREKCLATDSNCSNTVAIDASYHKVNESKSEPSCSKTTLSSIDSQHEVRFTQEA